MQAADSRANMQGNGVAPDEMSVSVGGDDPLQTAERNAKFDGLDEAAGYFPAAARSLQLRR